MRRTVLTGFLAAAGVAGLALQAPAEELKLIFVTLDSPHAHLNVNIHHPWAAKINKEANGLFKIDVRDGMALANHGNVYNRVMDDVAQIGWGLPPYAGGKFPLADVVSLPFLSNRSEPASVAFWRLYKSGALDKEFDTVVPLKLNVFPQSGMQFRKKPDTLDNLKGLKLIAGNRVSTQIIEALGGAPLSLRIFEYYEALQRGTGDGVVVGWTAFQPFKLAEVTHYHLEVQLGTSPGYVFMNRKKLASLPDKVRGIIMANSTEKEVRAFGKFWDRVMEEGRETTMKKPGHTILKLSEAQDKDWRAKVAPITDQWAKSQPGGEKVLAQYRDLLAKAEAGM
jgi:TRAP-type transport system periplasmic protein